MTTGPIALQKQSLRSLRSRRKSFLRRLAPLYALAGDPVVLRIVQTFSVVGMAFPLYWFARARIGYALALVIACAFLLSPILPSINVYDFHETPLATTPLAFE